MNYTIDKNTKLYIAESAHKGVKRVASYVAEDMRKVFGVTPSIISDETKIDKNAIVVRSLDVDVSDCDDSVIKNIKGKREVYSLSLNNDVLHIIGSDKRGTIYGLFHLSELMGVSPLVNWGDVKPLKKESVVLGEDDFITTKEPSVEFRGFFINDEWPAFGNWCNERFGGFNAECYERVFELLLRLKGNYLWPAMWSAQFNLDGPGLQNAELADELGVIMGMSHHEPCCRNGEEYRYVRGPKSPYGDDWNFVRNKDGITKFWEDGLKRNASFENVITVGMRGEADSTILGHEATLKDNIDYLRGVLETQNNLIKENVNEDIDKVPRMLALYKEVEPFFYGDESTKGLKGDPLLDGVTLMLCDDNFGNLRTIPDESMKNHKGGYGMYYHFDYHGSPISYEWINSSYLPKVWQEMTKAYDNDIRKLWIVNVGDVFTNEYPLGFFLDMAYDYEKWGASNKNAASEYNEWFINSLFPSFSPVEKETTLELLEGYTYLAHNYRPEAISAERLLENKRGDDLNEMYVKCKSYMYNAKLLYDGMSPNNRFTFFEYVYYPVMGYLNVLLMQLLTAQNHYLASIGAVKANELVSSIFDCVQFDKDLVEELHTINEGFWYGMGMSEHIGFKHWNEEECAKPVPHQVIAANKARLIAAVPGTYMHTEGGDWTKRPLKVYTDDSATINLFSAAYLDTYYDVECKDDFLFTDKMSGVLTSAGMDFITILVDKNVRGDNDIPGKVILHNDYGNIEILVYPKSMEPVKVLKNYRDELLSDYNVEVKEDGEYEIKVYISPANPPFKDNKLLHKVIVNGKENIVNAVSDSFSVGDHQTEWYDGVLNNIRISSFTTKLKTGTNQLRFEPVSVGVFYSKITIAAL